MCRICGIAARERWTSGAIEDAITVAGFVGYDVYEKALWLVGGDHPDDTEVAALNAIFWAAKGDKPRAQRLIHSAESRANGTPGFVIHDEIAAWSSEEIERMFARPGKVLPINRLPPLTNGSEIKFMGIDMGSEDMSAVAVARREADKIIFESVMYGEKAIDKALADALVTGKGMVRMIPNVFESEDAAIPLSEQEKRVIDDANEAAGLPRAHGTDKQTDKLPPQALEKKVDAMTDEERAEARRRINQAMGWKD